jgi:hypothetical protein
MNVDVLLSELNIASEINKYKIKKAIAAMPKAAHAYPGMSALVSSTWLCLTRALQLHFETSVRTM